MHARKRMNMNSSFSRVPTSVALRLAFAADYHKSLNMQCKYILANGQDKRHNGRNQIRLQHDLMVSISLLMVFTSYMLH